MHLYIDGTLVQEIDNHFDSLTNAWKEITIQINNEQRIIQKVVVDRQEFYVDYDVYFMQHYRHLESVEIYTIAISQAIEETLQEVLAYNRKVIASIDQVSQAFYGTLQPSDWDLFSQFSQGIDWLLDTLSFLQETIVEGSVYGTALPVINKTIVDLARQIRAIEGPVEAGDLVLVGDLIQYEFGPIFEELDTGLGDVLA